MNPHLQTIIDFIQHAEHLSDEEKNALLKDAKAADKELEITAFKLERTEKVKHTTAILLEETIEELEQKRKAVEAQNKELEIEAALEKVRSRSLAIHKSDELKEVVTVLFEKLKELQIPVTSAGITIFLEGSKDMNIYVCGQNDDGLVISNYRLPYFNHPICNDFHTAREKHLDFFVGNYSKDEKNSFYEYVLEFSSLKDLPNDIKEMIFQSPKYSISMATVNNSMIVINDFEGKLLSENETDIIKRFARVFEQAHTRFLDLQRAEAQSREAEIQLALERVRARAMAMQKSDELKELIGTVFIELTKLDLVLTRCLIMIYDITTNGSTWWMANSEAPSDPIGLFVKYHEHTPYLAYINAWKERNLKWQYTLEGTNKKEWDDFLFDETELSLLPDFVIEGMKAPDRVYLNASFNSFGNLTLASLESLSDEHFNILLRFAKVFDLTYTRFNDLKQAEAQAREAKIEAALERVRSKTMAMHNSEDVTSATETMFDELKKLGIDNLRCGIANIYHNKTFDVFGVTNLAGGNKMSGFGLFGMNEHPIWQRWFESWKNKEEVFIAYIAGQEKEEYFNNINNHPDYLPQQIVNFPDNFFQAYYFEEGAVWTYSLLEHSDPEKDIMKRFATGFSLTFRRYQDLKKAEAQAREATIEAALEKVRGKAMAMHNSNDLSVAASMVFTELRKLDINPIRCGVGLLHKESYKAQLYSATSSADGDHLSLVGWVQLEKHPVLEKIYDSWLQQYDYFPELQGEGLRRYYQLLLTGLNVAVPDTSDNQKQYGHFLPFSVGCLYAWSGTPYNETEIKILKRFASIIDLTFRRYIELQKSEANAKEAIKQAALDRIRADIASMRTVSDLDRITPLIWNELTILNIPFIRCGVFIMDDVQQLIHTFLSTPDGKAIAAFHLPYDTPGNFTEVITRWHNKQIYVDHWSEAEFISIAEILVKQGAIATKEQYLNTLPGDGFYLHFLPFLQGMLYVGNTTQLGEQEIKLIQSVADAFSTAYARYEDFNKLESAKQQIEKTLVDLKQTQAQLVQSEKMASLGELTAGIAHEIQNPLNFVNNFSEVSNELVDEMNDELDKGDIDEAKAIAEDIKQNLEKINHHGKRADAIVKGMLQHSRTSSGQKELTEINALCDEYLRLSYHGLRAKDKNFNADFKTDFDESIGKTNIIPQDIGRVIFNLINNAFYAVNEKRKLLTNNYQPIIKVKTRNLNHRIEIIVEDNGNGIPQNIVDKIFQPFFTTKPTGQGTGLGLSLSYDIIKAHGGEIKVECKEREGTEFIIVLPA
nr:ATP-binding protein [Panacibacter ginsenosidivorans]